MKNLAISNDEEEDLLVDGAATNISVNANLCLVGGFITDQSVNFNIIKSQIATIWKPKKGINIKDIEEHWLRADGFGESVGDDKQKEVKSGELNDYGIDKPVHMEKSGFSTVKSEEDVDDSSLELRKHKRPTFLCGNPHTLATSLTATTTAGLDTTSTIVDTTTTVVDMDYFIETGPGYEACQN
ncbi:hypothetical protein ACS0TY_008329 [Phlomoides rotata]